jgi:hypothetical protein
MQYNTKIMEESSSEGPLDKAKLRISTIDLFRNPPPQFESPEFIERFPNVRQNPAFVRIFDLAKENRSKRESVMALPSNRVSERQAYFESEIQKELAALEVSKEWFDLQRFLDSYGIQLVNSSLKKQESNHGTLPIAESFGTSCASSSSLTNASPERGNASKQLNFVSPPRKMQNSVSMSDMRASFLRCLNLKDKIESQWSQVLPSNVNLDELLLLSAPIAELAILFVQHGGNAHCVEDVKEIVYEIEKAEKTANLTKVMVKINFWKSQVLIFTEEVARVLKNRSLDTNSSAMLTAFQTCLKNLFDKCIKHLQLRLSNCAITDVSSLLDGNVLCRFYNYILDCYMERLRSLHLSNYLAKWEASKISVLNSKDMIDVSLNWVRLFGRCFSVLEIDAQQFDCKVAGITKDKNAVMIMTVLLCYRYCQYCLSDLIAKEDMKEFVENYCAYAKIDLHFNRILDDPFTPMLTEGIGVPLNPSKSIWSFDENPPSLVHVQNMGIKDEIGAKRSAQIVFKSKVVSPRPIWYFKRFHETIKVCNSKHNTHPNIVSVSHLEFPGLALPRFLLSDITSWMPANECIHFILDPKDCNGIPLSDFMLQECSLLSKIHAGTGRIDKPRAYTINRMLLSLLRDICNAVLELHEKYSIAHGQIGMDAVLVYGASNENTFAHTKDSKYNHVPSITAKILPPYVSLEPPSSFSLNDANEYNSTLAEDIKQLGHLFAKILDQVWYSSPIIYPSKRDPHPLSSIRLAHDNENDSKNAKRDLILKSMSSLHSNGTDTYRSSRSGSSSGVSLSRSDTLQSISSIGTPKKKKKRPITIHLAPSIHPPWSPLYNEMASVVHRPESPDPEDSNLEFETVPEPEGSSKEMESTFSNAQTILDENDEEGMRLNQMHKTLKDLIQRMLYKNETSRPVIREIFEYL